MQDVSYGTVLLRILRKNSLPGYYRALNMICESNAFTIIEVAIQGSNLTEKDGSSGQS